MVDKYQFVQTQVFCDIFLPVLFDQCYGVKMEIFQTYTKIEDNLTTLMFTLGGWIQGDGVNSIRYGGGIWTIFWLCHSIWGIKYHWILDFSKTVSQDVEFVMKQLMYEISLLEKEPQWVPAKWVKVRNVAMRKIREAFI